MSKLKDLGVKIWRKKSWVQNSSNKKIEDKKCNYIRSKMAKGKLCQNNLLEVKFTKKNGIKSVIKPKRNLSPKNERVSFEKKKSVYHSFKLLSEKFEFVR